MLDAILAEGKGLGHVIDRAKNSDDPFRLMGFGHRVYQATTIPGRRSSRRWPTSSSHRPDLNDPIFDLAQELEEIALKDPYFVERKLYPNVDFYSGISSTA